MHRVAQTEQVPHFKLPTFEGPLDLLLYLIQKHELDFDNLPLAVLVEQYLTVLRQMETMNLDVASEYLVMAATLILLKSRMLLPRRPEAGDGEPQTEDQLHELVRRLREYQAYKQAAEDLGDRPLLYRDVFPRPDQAQMLAETLITMMPASLFALIEAFGRILQRAEATGTSTILVERISVREQIRFLLRRFQERADYVFEDLMEQVHADKPTLVATFLGILELVRLQVLGVFQASSVEPILVRRIRDVDTVDLGILLEQVDEQEGGRPLDAAGPTDASTEAASPDADTPSEEPNQDEPTGPVQ